ncbi:MAG: hypothetical protein J3K34DRAFT_433303 [Monoraphidium minutum]|nr:MAG: hypothetical protein J3K34DRAFT_433303 [Monoraphidium minutum]
METRSKSKKLQVAAQRLWPLGEDMPGPVRDAVLAALPLPALPARDLPRRLRRGRRASAPGAPTGRQASPVARLPALGRVDYGTAYSPEAVDAAAAADAARAPTLASAIILVVLPNAAEHLWRGPIARLGRALARCPRLEAVSLAVPAAMFGELVGRPPPGPQPDQAGADRAV